MRRQAPGPVLQPHAPAQRRTDQAPMRRAPAPQPAGKGKVIVTNDEPGNDAPSAPVDPRGPTPAPRPLPKDSSPILV